MTIKDDDFRAFYEDHIGRLVRRIQYSERVPEATAEEIAQHAMMAVCLSWADIEPRARTTYLHVAAMREAMRVKKKNPPMSDIDSIPEQAAIDPEDGGDWPQYLAWLYQPLSERQRQVVTLCVLDDLPVTRVSWMLGIHENTVRNTLNRALGVLRNKLQEEGER